jgi:hypothetical protein
LLLAAAAVAWLVAVMLVEVEAVQAVSVLLRVYQ